jgi:proteic killer suppression protein
VIKSFKTEDTEHLFNNDAVRKWKSIESVARRKLNMIHAAAQLSDLNVPPGNRLHKLDKDREGQHAIRINDQYRFCFRWRDDNAYDVEITDYH